MQTYTENDLEKLADYLWNKFAKNRTSGVIFALVGELGAGKTTFTKHLAANAGIKDKILSPTFVLHREYPNFDHIDAWRIEDPQELINLGLDKMIADKRVVVIEWADKVEKEIKRLSERAIVIWIEFFQTKNENERRIGYKNSRY